METEGQKFYKHKIKLDTSNNHEMFSVLVPKGSTSYHEQVNDQNIINSKNIECDVIINEVIIKMEREYEDEIDNAELTETEGTINNDSSFQQTIIDMIPEKNMDVMRKSLEDDNDNEQIIQKADDHTIGKKNKQAGFKRSHIDFLRENEGFFRDSTSYKETDDRSSNDQDDQAPKKKKKTSPKDGKVDNAGLKKKRINKKKIRKDARSKGIQYVKANGTIAKERTMKPNPCLEKNCPYKCQEITTERRSAIFKHFWELSMERKKQWIISMTTKQSIKRKRSKNSNYRNNTFFYFINDGKSRRQVCLKFLMNTLDVTQRYIYYTLTK
ncbi:uncharacterized protein LOC114251837 [Bombyx mandarina]|uniref:Uncharacterized protein LOC114251837 n=1 Tax=Bombyx mandarina TaxID=7092 RepID=A0A6J2KPG8_BOMMA|nr:uncharacterized protein LOC114251837 [Bombyx mandarina]XP_028042035.1 uncharacterized protein LOC114251837 [Bombyx mandarina]